jgi:hypothetical protein
MDKTAVRHDQALRQLAEMELALARELQRRALEARDGKTAAELAIAFARTARSLRETITLQAELRRERERSYGQARQAQPAVRPQAAEDEHAPRDERPAKLN